MRGIADHCPTIDFAFVAGNLVDTLLSESGGHRALVQRGVDNVGHWKMDTVLNNKTAITVLELVVMTSLQQ